MTNSIVSENELRDYVVENIDKAIEDGYIRVFYQPVMRTITGEICGMEALARWDDPVHGLLAPYIFIGALEETNQIHKLDIYMVNTICDDYSRRLKNGENALAVSFNLSRLDFLLCDIQGEIEAAIEKNQVPRSALRIEITESTMENSAMHMHDVIDTFWKNGLRVWMDDFGSGYSSLNVLKDFHFDTLKIDMVFLRDFDIRSREIVKSIVDMAKRIGVHTLAEGVETKEQLEFLKNIGCEKAQGYYIGKPMLYDEVIDYLFRNDYKLEPESKHQYYHDIGCVNILSAVPFSSVKDNQTDMLRREQQRALSLVQMEGNKLKYLFANEPYLKVLNNLGIRDLEFIERRFGKTGSVFGLKSMDLLQKAIETGEVEYADFQLGSRECYVQIKKIASFQGGYAFLNIIYDITSNGIETNKKASREYMNSFNSMFDRVELVDLNTGFSKTLFQNAQTLSKYNRKPVKEEIITFMAEEIYADDRERFFEFINLETLEKRIELSENKFLNSHFRTRTENGDYLWELFTWVPAGPASERKYLSSCRRMSKDEVEVIERKYGNTDSKKIVEDNDEYISAIDLWNNFEMSSSTAFFWKDRNRRFLGANRRFLDYYGFSSVYDILGKTDEDMGWHIDPKPFRNIEQEVIEKGVHTHLVPGKCIRNGENRDIIVSKMPLYKNGKIVGLMGYFFDISDFKNEKGYLEDLSRRDVKTDTLNMLGIVEAIKHYQDVYTFDKVDFTLIYIDINNFRKHNMVFGANWGNVLLKEVGKSLKKAIKQRGVVGRLEADHFILIIQAGKESEIKIFIKQIHDEIMSIHEVENIPFTIYYKLGYALYSQYEDMQKMIDAAKEDSKKGREVE